jgi:hypothetical protein
MLSEEACVKKPHPSIYLILELIMGYDLKTAMNILALSKYTWNDKFLWRIAMQLVIPTYFHYYCMKGQNVKMELMLELGANIYHVKSNKKKLITWAGYRGGPDRTELVDDTEENFCENALKYVCLSGNTFTVTQILHLYDEDEILYTLHNICVMNIKESIIKILIETGVNLNKNLKNIYTPLLLNAVENNRRSIASMLIDAGADIDNGDRSSNPICKAIDKGYFTIFIELLNAGADLYIEVDRFHTAFDYADHSDEVFGHVLREFADTENAISLDQGLIYCCKYNFLDGVKQCLEEGANVYYLNDDRELAISIAKERGYQQIVEFLEAYIDDLEE